MANMASAGKETATNGQEDEVLPSMVPLVLVLTSISVMAFCLSSYVVNCPNETFYTTFASKSTLTLMVLVTLLIVKHSDNPKFISTKHLLIVSLLILFMPISVFGLQLVGNGFLIAYCIGHGLSGVGFASLLLMWETCLGRFLDNRQTTIVISISGTIAVFLTTSWMLFVAKEGVVLFVAFSAAAALALLFYLLESGKTNSKAQDKLLVAPAPNNAVFCSVASQTSIYGAFFMIMLQYNCPFQPGILLSMLIGFLIAMLGRKFGVDLIIAPSMGQRVITFGLIVALVICGIGANLSVLEESTFICIFLLMATGCFFVITSLSLFVIEARELGYNFARHIATARIPAWFGFFIGIFITGILLSSGLMPTNFSALMADFLIVCVTISTTFHKTTDPDFIKDKDTDNAEIPEISTDVSQARPFKVAAEQLAEKSNLTPREKDVYYPLLKGRSNKAIQEALYISTSTVKTHIASIYRKTGISSKQQLISVVEDAASSMIPQRKE